MAPHIPRTLALALALVFLSSALPAATAQFTNQQVGNFGTQVRVGDADYVPLTKKASIAVTVTEVVTSSGGSAIENCIILDVSATAGVQNNDIHLTPCAGRPAGAVIGLNDLFTSNTAIPAVNIAAAGLKFQFADVDGSGSYNKGDIMYLTTAAAGIVAPGATGSWTIRLSPYVTPAKTYPGGAFVLAGDQDFVQWNSVVKAGAMSFVQRDDKGNYLVPVAAAALPANSPVPTSSIRLATTAATQPILTALAIEQASLGDIEAGKDFSLAVTAFNSGTAAGAGLLVTKLDGAIVDARLSPAMSPGEQASFLIPLKGPATGGSHEVRVNDALTYINSKGPSASTSSAQLSAPAADSQELAKLQQQYNDLSAKFALLEAKQSSTPAAPAKADSALAMASPSPAAPVLLCVVALLALMIRRKQ